MKQLVSEDLYDQKFRDALLRYANVYEPTALLKFEVFDFGCAIGTAITFSDGMRNGIRKFRKSPHRNVSPEKDAWQALAALRSWHRSKLSSSVKS